jgi:hypothetical protein
VKVGKRISCRPLKKVMPKPRAGDPRKLFTQFVLKKDWSKFRNRRGKRPPSLPRLIRKAGRGATFERTTPPGFPGASGGYVLKAGSVSIHYSGGSIVGDALCNMSGSTFVDLFQDAGGSIGVNPVDPAKLFEEGPHNYSGNVTLGFGPEVDLIESSCADPNHNGTVHADFPVGAIQVLDTGPDQLQSPDGIHYNGSYSDSGSGITQQRTWVLTGTKDPP